MAKKVLKLVFKNAKEKSKMITIADPKEGLSKEVVQESMTKIAATKAFTKDEVVLYDSVDENGDTIQGLISIVGNLQNPEGSYVLQSVYRSEVGSISSLNFTDENSTTIVDEINSINSRLK